MPAKDIQSAWTLAMSLTLHLHHVLYSSSGKGEAEYQWCQMYASCGFLHAGPDMLSGSKYLKDGNTIEEEELLSGG